MSVSLVSLSVREVGLSENGVGLLESGFLGLSERELALSESGVGSFVAVSVGFLGSIACRKRRSSCAAMKRSSPPRARFCTAMSRMASVFARRSEEEKQVHCSVAQRSPKACASGPLCERQARRSRWSH